MLTRIMKPREDGEKGFTLIELLVVVAIIGILAAIAIPVFLIQRNSARDASVKSDLNSVAQVMETQYVIDNAYPTTGTPLTAFDTDNQPKTSPSNVIVITATATGYTITGCNTESSVTYTYSSSGGGLSDITAPGCTGTAGVTFA
jgi:type IV pilus assembly protein PilA